MLWLLKSISCYLQYYCYGNNIWVLENYNHVTSNVIGCIDCTIADRILLYSFVNIGNISTVCSWPQINRILQTRVKKTLCFLVSHLTFWKSLQHAWKPHCSGCGLIDSVIFATCAGLICVGAACWTGSADILLHCNYIFGRSSSYPMSTQCINQDKSVIFPWICVWYHLRVIFFLPPTSFLQTG